MFIVVELNQNAVYIGYNAKTQNDKIAKDFNNTQKKYLIKYEKENE